MTDSLHKQIDGRGVEIFNDDTRFIVEVIDNNAYDDVFKNLAVIDLGANIGSFSYWIYDRASKIYAIEPAPRCIELMTRTRDVGGLNKLNIYQMAISGTGGDREFFFDPYETGGGGKLNPSPFPSNKSLTVKTKTISEFMTDEGIERVDILKIDVEGAEKEIFRSDAFKEVADKIKTIVGEYHSYDPTKDLEDCGFIVFNDTGHSTFVARRA